jgi:hypothetical protein
MRALAGWLMHRGDKIASMGRQLPDRLNQTEFECTTARDLRQSAASHHRSAASVRHQLVSLAHYLNREAARLEADIADAHRRRRLAAVEDARRRELAAKRRS